MSAVEARPIPNLRELGSEEISELTMKMIQYQRQGRYLDAEALANEVPLLAGVANVMKEQMGIDALIRSGKNLSLAVKTYGPGWLES